MRHRIYSNNTPLAKRRMFYVRVVSNETAFGDYFEPIFGRSPAGARNAVRRDLQGRFPKARVRVRVVRELTPQERRSICVQNPGKEG